MSEYSELKLESFEFHRYNFATSNFPSFHLEDLSVQQESENREKKRGIQVSFQRKSPSRKDIDRARETGRDREGGRAWKGELPSFCAIDSPSFQDMGYVVDMSRHSRGSFHYFYLMLVLCTGSLGGSRKRGNRGNENENFRFYTQSLFRICETPLPYHSLSPLLYRCLSVSFLQPQLCKLICPASRMGCSKTTSVVDTF